MENMASSHVNVSNGFIDSYSRILLESYLRIAQREWPNTCLL